MNILMRLLKKQNEIKEIFKICKLENPTIDGSLFLRQRTNISSIEIKVAKGKELRLHRMEKAEMLLEELLGLKVFLNV